MVIVDWLEGIIMLIYTVPEFPISGAQTDFPFKFINFYKHFSNENVEIPCICLTFILTQY